MNPQLELITEQLRQGREVASNHLFSLANTESRADVRRFIEALAEAEKPKEINLGRIQKLIDSVTEAVGSIGSEIDDIESKMEEIEEELGL